MASVLLEKKVLFSGIWKPSPSANQDSLLKQISAQFLQKKSLVATYQLCTDGLRLLVIHDNGRTGPRSEKIPLQSIQEITANRYNLMCLMTVYVDSERRTNYLVCRCENERDAAQIVGVFIQHKKSLSGEGYRIDLVKPQGRNWTLMPKEEDAYMNGHSEPSSDSGEFVQGGRVVVASNGGTGYHKRHVSEEMATLVENFEREECELDGRLGYSVAVQTDLMDLDSDRESMMSTTSFQSLKSELLSLSQEIREIKFLLEQTTGISSAEYFKRDVNIMNGDSRNSYVPVDVNEADLPSPSPRSSESDKKVNFADDVLPDHDIRSFGVQTEKGERRGYYTKRQGRSETRMLVNTRGKGRHRSSSSSSIPMSPGSIGRANGSDVFDMPGTRGVYIRGSDPRGQSGYSTTIERPIEQVYNVYSRNFRNPRKKIVVMPGHNTMPSLRRPVGHSTSSMSQQDFDDDHLH